MMGFATATSTLVGRGIGESRPDLAARATWSSFQLTFTYMAIISALYVIMPRPFIAPFGAKASPTEFVALSSMAVIMLRYVAVYSIFDGANLIFSAALKGAGDTVFVMFMTSSLSMLLMVLPTWLTLREGGSIWTAWFWLSAFIIILAFCFLARFLQGRWRTMRVTEGHHAPLSPTSITPDVPMADAEVS
jgi:MATE family multidrug resistance protein